MEFVWLLVGFFLLLYSGKYLVNGSVAIAEKLNVSKLVIGVTVVSFGTSAPELFVSALATYNGHPELAIGNVVGSNIANIALVLAITVLIIPIPVKKNTVLFDTPFMIGVSIVLFIVAAFGKLNYITGLFFWALLLTFIIHSIKKSRKESLGAEEVEHVRSLWLAILFVLLSSVGLAVGSKLLVDNASIIASNLGVSERIIAITMIAFGTSLPELATSVIAAMKKEMDISVGNIVGSNIYNILAVLGISALIKPIPVSSEFIKTDMPLMLAIAVLLFLFILPVKRSKLNRWNGLVLLLVYAVYVTYLVMQ